MGLTSVIGTAASGLRATQAGMDVVSQNVANAGSVGYTRRTLTSTQQVSGDQTTGVNVVGATRILNSLVQRQLRLETAGASYTAVRSSYASSLDAMFDAPGGTGSLSTLVNAYAGSLQSLANAPDQYTAQAGTLAAASDLAGSLNSLTKQVQSLRQNTEDALAQDVDKANTLLKQIAQVNAQVTSPSADTGTAAFQDQRDALIDQLSELVDVNVTQQANGSVTIATTGGFTLFDGSSSAQLSFDRRSPIGAQSAYGTDPAKRSVGTITATDSLGHKSDLIASGVIRSGEIKGLVELRDETLVQSQRQLDEFAAGLASSLSDKTVAGTPVPATAASGTGFSFDLSKLSPGNSLTVATTAGGVAKTVTFVRADSAASATAATSADGSTVGLDMSAGMTAVVAKVQATLGSSSQFNVSSPGGSTLSILDNGPTGTTATTSVTAMSALTSVTDPLNGSGQLALFVDGDAGQPYSGSLEHGSQLTGFAGRIQVSKTVAASPTSLVNFTTPMKQDETPTRPIFLLDQLTSASRTFTGASGIGGSNAPYTGTLADFSSQIVVTQAANANSATQLNEGQQTVLNAVKSRYSQDAGVNIDTEMTQLIQLQTAYGANARILTAAKDMMDMLLRVGQ